MNRLIIESIEGRILAGYYHVGRHHDLVWMGGD